MNSENTITSYTYIYIYIYTGPYFMCCVSENAHLRCCLFFACVAWHSPLFPPIERYLNIVELKWRNSLPLAREARRVDGGTRSHPVRRGLNCSAKWRRVSLTNSPRGAARCLNGMRRRQEETDPENKLALKGHASIGPKIKELEFKTVNIVGMESIYPVQEPLPEAHLLE